MILSLGGSGQGGAGGNAGATTGGAQGFYNAGATVGISASIFLIALVLFALFMLRKH